MTKATIEEVRDAPPASDEREAMETETNGDQRDGDEKPTGEKPEGVREEVPGARFKDRDVTRAGQSAALPLFRRQSVNDKPLRLDIKWLEVFDSKITVLINRHGVDPRDYGGKDLQEWIHSSISRARVMNATISNYRELMVAAEPYVRQEGKGQYRCKHCQKLFIASSFVEKHVTTKNPELLKHIDDVGGFILYSGKNYSTF